MRQFLWLPEPHWLTGLCGFNRNTRTASSVLIHFNVRATLWDHRSPTITILHIRSFSYHSANLTHHSHYKQVNCTRLWFLNKEVAREKNEITHKRNPHKNKSHPTLSKDDQIRSSAVYSTQGEESITALEWDITVHSSKQFAWQIVVAW